MTRRDPQGRRRAIVHAAIGVIAEVGIARATHRLIAERAGVPLGSTTYYYPTLDDLVAEALREVTEAARAGLEQWADQLTGGDDQVGTLIALVRDCLDDREETLVCYELTLAAARVPELRPAAVLWIDGLRGICARIAGGPERGFALAALIDGTVLRSLASGQPPDEEWLRVGLDALVNPRTTAGST